MFLRLFYISLAFKSVEQADCQLQAFLSDLADRSDESDKLFLFSVNVPRSASGGFGATALPQDHNRLPSAGDKRVVGDNSFGETAGKFFKIVGRIQ